MTKERREAYFNELNDIYDEMVARDLSNNIINPQYESWSWTELCLRAINILAVLAQREYDVAL